LRTNENQELSDEEEMEYFISIATGTSPKLPERHTKAKKSPPMTRQIAALLDDVGRNMGSEDYAKYAESLHRMSDDELDDAVGQAIADEYFRSNP